MRSVIFQIGLLLFFVSIVALWLQGMDIIVAVVKSFVLFVVATLMMFLMAYLLIYLRNSGDKNEVSSNGNFNDSKA